MTRDHARRRSDTSADPEELRVLRDEVASLRAQRAALANGLPHRIFAKDTRSTYLFVNDAYARSLGQPAEALVGTNDLNWFPRDLADRYRADDQRVVERGEPVVVVEPYQDTTGSFWIRTSKFPIRDAEGGVAGVLGMFEDVTAEHDLRWTFETLLQCNTTLARARTEREAYQAVCDSLTQRGVFRLAWVGIPQSGLAKLLVPEVVAGPGAGYVDGFVATWDDSPLGAGPGGRAIREQKTQVVNDLSGSAAFAPWQHRAAAHGLRSNVALPILMDGAPLAVLTVYAAEANRFGTEEVRLLERLAADMAFTIHGLRVSDRLAVALSEQHAQRAQTEVLFERTIAAIASMVEQRDPYTAGHESRVAKLAVAIGRACGLGEEQLRGLGLAALVHDLGKIQIPFEILNKPGRLSAIEYELVKTHAEAGYAVLKGIDFPWPLAEMVRQHHEALDGTGYPLGIQGEAILFESRILTVADIVESMSSHRPYRPSLGIERALDEIRRLRGTKLDPRVVDACLRLAELGEIG